MNAILLFDIDGTLIDAGRSGRRALELAFEHHFGPHDDAFGFSFGGMTDRSIIRGGMKAIGRPPEADDELDAVIATYLEILPQEIETEAEYRVLPGIPDLMHHLKELSRYAMGLGTGNVEKGARIKLERGKLNHHFSFGGFGCDAEDRTQLIASGIRRGRQMSSSQAPALVIGDTPRDVVAAHEAGARCLAVATGSYSAQELTEAGADRVVEGLEDRAIPQIIEQLIS